MDEQRAETNRGRVRRILWQPLEDLGMKRARKQTETARQEMKDRVADWLVWMSDEGLEVLTETVERHARGALGNEWPSEITMRSFARGIEREPEPRLVRSWMASAAGRAAWEQSPVLAVAVHAYLAAKRRPPNDWDMRGLEREARERAADDARARDRVRTGRATDDDRRMIAALERRVAEVKAIVFGEAADAA